MPGLDQLPDEAVAPLLHEAQEMLCGLGEAGSTLGQWDGQYNSLFMSGSRLRSNQGLLKGHKSGSLYLSFDPYTFDCSSYLSLHRQDPVPACHPHFVLGSLLSRFLSGVVESTELAGNCSLLFSLVKTQLLLFAYRGVRQLYQHCWGRNNRGWQPCQCEDTLKFLSWRGRSPPLSS